MNTIQYSFKAVRYMQQVFSYSISIASAVFAALTRWQTDWQTDRPRCWVGNNRRSAQWRSQILLLSPATRCFPGPTRVVDANGISIASAVFAGLTMWQTDWQTYRSRYSVGDNGRSAQWRSQILLLSTATTSIYWSSRLDRSDQLQQSAAIFSSKIRRVAMYVDTHYNIASKRAFLTIVPDRWHNCLLIYWHTSCLVPIDDI